MHQTPDRQYQCQQGSILPQNSVMLCLESRGSRKGYLTQNYPSLFKNSCESSSNDCTIRTSNYCQDSIWIKSLATVLLQKHLQAKTEFRVMSQYLPVILLRVQPQHLTEDFLFVYFLFLSCRRILIQPRNVTQRHK